MSPDLTCSRVMGMSIRVERDAEEVMYSLCLVPTIQACQGGRVALVGQIAQNEDS